MPSSLLIFLATATILVTGVRAIQTNPESELGSDKGQALFLTPLIRQGQFEQAKEKCRVQKVGLMDFESYSGFLTARGPPDNANLFFWFFPAVNNRADVPIVLLLGGGPGVSVLQMLFNGNGPYLITTNGTLVHRTNHWLNGFNIIYLDAPVGTGYSFASSKAAYTRNVTATSKDLVEAVLQFFTLFSEYATNDFYVLGESYGGRYAAVLGQRLHTTQLHRSNGSSSLINLKGVISVSAPLAYDPQYFGLADFYHTNGLLTTEQYVSVEQTERQVMDSIKTGNFQLANTKVRDLFMNHSSPFIHYITLTTGFDKLLSMAQSYQSLSQISFNTFLDQASVRQTLHVGSTPYHTSTNKEAMNYLDDIAASVIPALDDVLKEGYRVMLAYGLNDMAAVPLVAQRMASKLQWKGATQFNATERTVWKLEGDPEVAGYVIPGQDLWFAAVRNSGHVLISEKPLAAFNLLTRFTKNNSTF